MRTFALLFLTLFALNISAQSYQMTLKGSLPYPGNMLANLWGYVASDGTEYAIVGTQLGVSIVSLADPTNPTEVQFLPGINNIWREAKVYDHYAYISTEAPSGLRIIDLQGLPNAVNYKDTVMNGVYRIHTVSEADGFLYLNGVRDSSGNNWDNGGVYIYDLHQNPWIPQYVGKYSTRYVHDCYVRGNTMYAAAVYDGILGIVDITDKTNPVDVGAHTYANSFTHNTWLNDAGNVCFSTDEKNEAYVYAWDITDPSNVLELDKIRSTLSGGLSVPHNVHVLNDFVVTAYYTDGVVVFDGSRPHNLVQVGYYDTSPSSGGGFNGVWGVYPYFPSGLVVATDRQEGLFVLKPEYLRACYLEGKIYDAQTLQPLAGATIDIAFAQEISQNDGDYATGVGMAGLYAVTYSHPNYLSQTQNINLNNGVVTQQDIYLQPLNSSIEISANFNLYPNPSNAFTIETELQKGEVLIYDLQGKLLEKHTLAEKTRIEPQVNRGMYFVSIQDEKGNSLGVRKWIHE